jgi:hypothetical protein
MAKYLKQRIDIFRTIEFLEKHKANTQFKIDKLKRKLEDE